MAQASFIVKGIIMRVWIEALTMLKCADGAGGELLHKRCKREGWFFSEGKRISLELRVSLKAVNGVNLRIIH